MSAFNSTSVAAERERRSEVRIGTSVEQKAVAVAEVDPRDAVVVAAEVPTKAGEKLAAAEAERLRALEAADSREGAHDRAANARPVHHLKTAIVDLGTKISSKVEGALESLAIRQHEKDAREQEMRVLKEQEAARQRAIDAALREAELAAAETKRGAKVVAAGGTAEEFVAVAEVAPQPKAFGIAVVETHADEHLAKAVDARERLETATLRKEDLKSRAEAAHVGCELKASVKGVGTKVASKVHEAKEWVSEKVHDRHADAKETAADLTLKRDLAIAKNMALEAAEREAARHDGSAHLVSETVTTVEAAQG